MITLDLNFTYFVEGKSYWKHNSSLLSEIEFLNIINKKITEVERQYALPIYDPEGIKNVPKEVLQLVINDQLFPRCTFDGNSRENYFICQF